MMGLQNTSRALLDLQQSLQSSNPVLPLKPIKRNISMNKASKRSMGMTYANKPMVTQQRAGSQLNIEGDVVYDDYVSSSQEDTRHGHHSSEKVFNSTSNYTNSVS